MKTLITAVEILFPEEGRPKPPVRSTSLLTPIMALVFAIAPMVVMVHAVVHTA